MSTFNYLNRRQQSLDLYNHSEEAAAAGSAAQELLSHYQSCSLLLSSTRRMSNTTTTSDEEATHSKIARLEKPDVVVKRILGNGAYSSVYLVSVPLLKPTCQENED